MISLQASKMALRWVAALAAVAVIACLSFAAGGLNEAFCPPSASHVPLTEKLPATWKQATEVFDTRIKTSFPIGSSLAVMTKALQSQGFVRGDWSDAGGDLHWAFRREDSFPCNIQASVYWRHDEAGKLTDIRGSYGEVGCL